MKNKHVVITKVVTKNFVQDFFSKIRNFVGMNLTPYEDMINKAISQIQTQLEEEDTVLKWYRYEITQLTNGAVAVMLYGDKK